MTGQGAQTSLALRSIFARAGPRSPYGGKNMWIGIERHAPWSCHSHSSVCGGGNCTRGKGWGMVVDSRRSACR